MKKTKLIFLIVALLICVLSLNSCLSLAGAISNSRGDDSDAEDGGDDETQDKGEDSLISRDELEDILDDYYKQGDSFDITINTEGEGSLIAVCKAVLSVVRIRSETGAGAGVIYKLDKEKGDAYVITNYHVVYDEKNGISKDIKLYLYGQERTDYAIDASFVGGALSYDLAVLKVKGSSILRGSNAVAASFADSNDISILETAIAVGNPKDLGISATVGHVSVDSEYIEIAMTQTRTVELRVIRMDTPVNSGNSGGGLFNDKAELIGIVNAKYTATSVSDIGYAIPSNIVKYVADNIIYYCNGTTKTSVYKCLLNVTVTAKSLYTEYDTETGRVYKRERVQIESVDEGGLAYGRLEVGDVILGISIDGVDYEVSRMHCVVDSMINARVGSRAVVTVERGGERLTVPIDITAAAMTEIN